MSMLREAVRAAFDAIPDVDELRIGKARDRLFDAFQRLALLATQRDDEAIAHRKPDRGAVLRMAGNIASGMCSDEDGYSYRIEREHELIAEMSVDIAKRILARVDKVE